MSRKTWILIFILFCWLYVGTGRYYEVLDAIQREGYAVLLREPMWIISWFAEKWHQISGAIHQFIDQKNLGRALP